MKNLLHQQCPHLPGHRQRCLRGQFDIGGLGKCVAAGFLNFRFRSLDHHILRRRLKKQNKNSSKHKRLKFFEYKAKNIYFRTTVCQNDSATKFFDHLQLFQPITK